MRAPVLLVFVALAACSDTRAPLERVVIAADGSGFETRESHAPFVPFGFNYDHDRSSRLLEEYWETEWDVVVQDFDEMAALGATVVRIHIQIGAFLRGPSDVDEAALARLADLAAVARERGLRLDVTGLASYRASAEPAWLGALDEEARWNAQAFFWAAVAERLAGEEAIFAYDLINEPAIPTTPATDWTPGALGDFSYVQNLVLDLGGRDPRAIGQAWRRRMVDAIRAHDTETLITVGQLPFESAAGFAPADVAADLSYLSVHVYPESSDLPAATRVVDAFGAAGVPVVIEEMFPLACTAAELGTFILGSRGTASGWIGFYWGATREELRAIGDVPAAILLSWLDLFVSLRGDLVR